MTLEKASELVGALRERSPKMDTKAEDLFEYFVCALGLGSLEEIEMFAVMCGYKVAREVRLSPESDPSPEY